MNNDKNETIKIQEWIVRFDGQFSQYEKFIKSEEYHNKIYNINN